MRRGRGFTLVELLVVLVIIGILVGLILPNALRAINQAHTKECAANIRSIDTAIQMFHTENNAWPDDMAALGVQYFSDNAAPVCPFDAAYTFETVENGRRVNRGEHFTTWPTVHGAGAGGGEPAP